MPLTLSLYVDDFVFFSICYVVEYKFQSIFSCMLMVNFMGVIAWFLGIHFSWHLASGKVDIHINQSSLTRNPVERFNMQDWAHYPTATPYRS